MKNAISRKTAKDNNAFAKKQETSLDSVTKAKQETHKNKADLIAKLLKKSSDKGGAK